MGETEAGVRRDTGNRLASQLEVWTPEKITGHVSHNPDPSNDHDKSDTPEYESGVSLVPWNVVPGVASLLTLAHAIRSILTNKHSWGFMLWDGYYTGARAGLRLLI